MGATRVAKLFKNGASQLCVSRPIFVLTEMKSISRAMNGQETSSCLLDRELVLGPIFLNSGKQLTFPTILCVNVP